MFDEPTRRASQGNLQGFGDALAGRGADLNQTIQVAPAALRPPRLGHGQPVRAAHRAAVLLQGARRRRAHRRAGLEDQRAPVHDDGRHLRGDLARPAGAEGHDLQEPADAATPAPSRCASSARSSSTPPRSRATSTPPPTELRGALPTVNSRAARRHAGAAALGRAQRQPAGRARRARGPRQGADHDRRAARPDGDRRHAAAAAALPRPVRHGLQLLEHLLDLRGRAPLGARRHRLARSARC